MRYRELERVRLQVSRRLDRRFGCRLNPAGLLIDFPVQRSLKLGEDVDVVMRDGGVRPLTDVSRLVAALPVAFRDNNQRLRLFLSPEVDDKYHDDPEVAAEGLRFVKEAVDGRI
jgi:hypothetical protein